MAIEIKRLDAEQVAVSGNRILRRADVERSLSQLAAMKAQAQAARDGLDAAALLARAQAQFERRIAAIDSRAAELTAALEQLDKA